MFLSGCVGRCDEKKNRLVRYGEADRLCVCVCERMDIFADEIR